MCFFSSCPLSNSVRIGLCLSDKNLCKHFSSISSFFFLKRIFFLSFGFFCLCYLSRVHGCMPRKRKIYIESSRFFCLHCVSRMCFPCCFLFRTDFLYSIWDHLIQKDFKGVHMIRLCLLRFMDYTTEVILNELQKNNVDMDMKTLSYHISYVQEQHETSYNRMAARINPKGI